MTAHDQVTVVVVVVGAGGVFVATRGDGAKVDDLQGKNGDVIYAENPINDIDTQN